MGLLQQAYKTYESHYADVGKVFENQEPLAPVSHLTTKAKIEITINEDDFLNVKNIKDIVDLVTKYVELKNKDNEDNKYNIENDSEIDSEENEDNN